MIKKLNKQSIYELLCFVCSVTYNAFNRSFSSITIGRLVVGIITLIDNDFFFCLITNTTLQCVAELFFIITMTK